MAGIILTNQLMYRSYLQRVATYTLSIEVFVSEIILKLLITGLVPRPEEEQAFGPGNEATSLRKSNC